MGYEINQYNIRVRSVYENEVSLFSSPINVKLYIYPLVDLYIKDNQIHLSKYENITYDYEMLVDITKTKGETNTGIIDIPTRFQDRLIKFQFKMILNKIAIKTLSLDIDLTTAVIFRHENYEIEVNNAKKVFVDDIEMTEEVTLLTDKVILSPKTLKSLPTEAIISVIGDDYYIKRLRLLDPIELISARVINESESTSFTYNGPGYQINNVVNGNNILTETNDYTYKDGILTLTEGFIETFKLNNPDKKVIYLKVSFLKDNTVIYVPSGESLEIHLDA